MGGLTTLAKQFDDLWVLEQLSDKGVWVPLSVYEGEYYAVQGRKIKEARVRVPMRVSQFRRVL